MDVLYHKLCKFIQEVKWLQDSLFTVCLTALFLGIYEYFITINKVIPKAFVIKYIDPNNLPISTNNFLIIALILSVIILLFLNYSPKYNKFIDKLTISIIPALLIFIPGDNFFRLLLFILSAIIIVMQLCYYFLPLRTIHLFIEKKLFEKYKNLPFFITLIVFLILTIYAVKIQITYVENGQLFYSDWGIFLNVADNTLQGKYFYSNQLEYNFMGQHFMPTVILFLLPFITLFRNIETLFIINSILLFSNGLIIYAFCRQLKLSRFVAMILGCIIILSPSLLNLNLAMMYGFHGIYLVIPLMLICWMMFDKKKYYFAALFFILILLTKETTAPMFFGVGICFLFQKRYFLGFFLMVFSTLYFLIITKFIMPQLLPLDHAHYGFFSYYKSLGSSYTEILLSPITKAKIFWSRIFSINSINYILALTIPFIIVIVRRPSYLFGGSLIIIFTFLMDSRARVNLELQYQAEVLPFIFLATIYGLYSLRKNKQLQFATLWAMLFGVLLMNYYISPYPFAKRKMFIQTSEKSEYKRTIEVIKYIVPEKATLTADEHIAPLFVLRNDTYLNFDDPKDYVVLQFNGFLSREKVAKHRAQIASSENYKLALNYKSFNEKNIATNTILIFKRVPKQQSDINNQIIVTSKIWKQLGAPITIFYQNTKKGLASVNAKIVQMPKSKQYNIYLRKETKSQKDYVFVIRVWDKNDQVIETTSLFMDGAIPFYQAKIGILNKVDDKVFIDKLNKLILNNAIKKVHIQAIDLPTP